MPERAAALTVEAMPQAMSLFLATSNNRPMTPLRIVEEVRTRLEESGLHGALALLNSRTPHRFTGAYRYGGEILRNEGLFDRFSPEIERGDDVPMSLAYRALVGERGGGLQFSDARGDPHVTWKPGIASSRIAAPCYVTHPGTPTEHCATSTSGAVSRT